MKDQVYADNPQSIETLKINIWHVISEIEPKLWKYVIENVDKKIDVYNVVEVDIYLILFFIHKLSTFHIIYR